MGSGRGRRQGGLVQVGGKLPWTWSFFGCLALVLATWVGLPHLPGLPYPVLSAGILGLWLLFCAFAWEETVLSEWSMSSARVQLVFGRISRRQLILLPRKLAKITLTNSGRLQFDHVYTPPVADLPAVYAALMQMPPKTGPTPVELDDPRLEPGEKVYWAREPYLLTDRRLLAGRKTVLLNRLDRIELQGRRLRVGGVSIPYASEHHEIFEKVISLTAG